MSSKKETLICTGACMYNCMQVWLDSHRYAVIAMLSWQCRAQLKSSGVNCSAHQITVHSAIQDCPEYCQQKDEVIQNLVHS